MPKGQGLRGVARRKIVAREIAAGKSSEEASRIAGYPDNPSFAVNASKRAARDDVQRWVAEFQDAAVKRVGDLQDAAAKRNEITVDSLIAEAEEARLAAMEKGQIAAAISAIKEKGVLAGVRVERREQGEAGEFALIEQLSRDELIAFIDGELTLESLRERYPGFAERNFGSGGKLN